MWFFCVDNDGFKKTSSKYGRPPIPDNDLMQLKRLWGDKEDSDQSFSVSYETIKEYKYKLTTNPYLSNQAKDNWITLGGKNGVCDILVGGTPSTKDKKCWGGEHLWVTIEDMKSKYISDTVRKITDRGVKQSNVKLLSKGTVLFSFKLTIGKLAIASKELYTNEAIAGIVPKENNKVRPIYLYYILSGIDFKPFMQPASKGYTLNKALIESIKIPLPNVKEQDTYIANLEKIERTIDSYKDLIRKLQTESMEFTSKFIDKT